MGGKAPICVMLELMLSPLVWDLGQMPVGWGLWCGKATFFNNLSYSRAVVSCFLQICLVNTRGPRLVERKAHSSFAKRNREAEWKQQVGFTAQLCVEFNCLWLCDRQAGEGAVPDDD